MERGVGVVVGHLVACGVLLLTGCGAGADEAPVEPGVAATEPVPCAELPAQTGDGRDHEGWWSSSPSDADGHIETDPAQWPPVVRAHLRTALVLADSGEVLSTWDRLTCGAIPDYTPPPGSGWPAGSVVVLDATTGEVVESFPDTSAGQQVAAMVDVARDGLAPDAVPQGYHLVDVRSAGTEPVHVYATDDYDAHQADPGHPRGPLVAVRLLPIPPGARETQPPPPDGIDVVERPDIAEGAVLYLEPGGAGPSLTIPAGDADIIVAGTDAGPEVVLQFADAIARGR